MKKRKPLPISKQNIMTTVRALIPGKRTIIKRTLIASGTVPATALIDSTTLDELVDSTTLDYLVES